MNIVTRKLIAKEFFMNRWLIGGAVIASLISAAICTLGKMAFNVGSLSWLTTIIGVGVMLALYGVMSERKERSLHFVLSLPISVRDYVLAKLLGLLLSFCAAWLVASGAAVALVLLTPVPDGLLPFVILLCVFLLANFSVVLSGALQARSEGATIATVVVTNMAVSIFMFTVGALPEIKQHMEGAIPVWNRTFFIVLLCELVVLFIALVMPLATAARRRDFL